MWKVLKKKRKIHEGDTPSAEELLGPNKLESINSLRGFLTNTSDNVRICLITGPIGSGKSFIVNKVCSELEYTVCNVDLVVEPSEIKLEIAGIMSSTVSVESKKRVLVIDGVVSALTRHMDSLLKYGSSSKKTEKQTTSKKKKPKKSKKADCSMPSSKTIPVILMSNERFAGNTSIMKASQVKINILPVSVDQLRRYLFSKHEINVSKEIISDANGDIRFLTNLGHFPVRQERIDSKGRTRPDTAAKKILYSKLPFDEKLEYFFVDTEKVPEVIRNEMLHQVPFFQGDKKKYSQELSTSFSVAQWKLDCISLGDVIDRLIKREFLWDLLETKGVLTCNAMTAVTLQQPPKRQPMAKKNVSNNGVILDLDDEVPVLSFQPELDSIVDNIKKWK